MDLRKSAQTAMVGSVRFLKNAHITPGGEVEKRMAFVDVGGLPGSHGLAGLDGNLYAFRKAPPLNSDPVTLQPPLPGLSIDTFYVNLQIPSGDIAEVLDNDLYDGKHYVIIRNTNGSIQHYYDTVLVPDGKGESIITYRTKIYGVEDRNLHFSSTGNPADWTGTGSGFINLSEQSSEQEKLNGIEIYFDSLAVFSAHAIHIWAMDPDPNLNEEQQIIRNLGSIAPRSPTQFSAGDVLFLATSGIRSLRARDSSQSAQITDIGSPLDPEMQYLINTRPPEEILKVQGLVNPLSGRFWLIWKDAIYVLSHFPDVKITAWSKYEPEFNITDAANVGNFMALRDENDRVYVYGGDTNNLYDDCEVEIITPFIGAGRDATFKQFTAYDQSARGTWSVEAAFDPMRDDVFDLIGNVNGTTFAQGSLEMTGYSTHFMLKLKNKEAGKTAFARAIVHFDMANED